MNWLRVGLIEDMAKADHLMTDAMGSWVDCEIKETHRDHAAGSLDALLGGLDKRREEWLRAGQIGHGAWGLASPQIIDGLIAALREATE